MVPFSSLFLLFVFFSFIGWCGEVVFTALTNKKFVNRGAMLGPVIPLYGIMTLGVLLFHEPHKNTLFATLLGATILCAAIEVVAGVVLEHTLHARWWDYSDRKLNLRGYTSLQSALVKGIFVGLGAKYLYPPFQWVLNKLPALAVNLIALAALVVFVVDAGVLLFGVAHIRKRWKMSEQIAMRLQQTSSKLEQNLSQTAEGFTERLHHKHLKKAFPALEKPETFSAEKTVFAQGLGFRKLFWLFLIGAFVGDIIETIFVFVTSGVLMSRSSLLYGPFSVVWGLGAVLLTVVLYGLREKSDRYIFIGGTLLGGVYEYMCSVITEKAFGKVFWDYSAIPFNLNGRINLLYCVFWGALAVVWIKEVYPRVEKLIEKIPYRIGVPLTRILVVLFIIDGILTCAALARLQQRENGVPATNSIQVVLDDWYPDDYLYHRYQNML